MTTEKLPTEDAEIIELVDFQKNDEPMLRVKRGPTCWCKLVLNEHDRTVKCSRCGRSYDHFDALIFIARNIERLHGSAKRMKDDVARLTKKRDDIRAEIKGLK